MRLPADSAPENFISTWSQPCKQPETYFLFSLQLKLLKRHMTMTDVAGRYLPSRWSWTYRASNSLELEKPFMPMWLDLTSVPFGNNARLSRVELSPCSVFFFHFLTPNFMRSFSPLGRSGPARAEVGVGFRFVRLVQAFPSPPPLRWSCSVSVGLRFSLHLPFQGWRAPGQVCWCWCLLFPSSFAFPASRPG